MAADAGVDSAAANLNLNPDEKRLYGQLFRQADTDGVGIVTGEIAVKFFDKTRLDSRVLGEIWQIADKENRGFLTPAGFGIVLRLIGHAQAGREPTSQLAFQQSPLPRFDGFNPQPAPAPVQPQTTGGGSRAPPLTSDKVNQYTGLWERQPLQNHMLPGEQARQIFDKSGLPNEVLGKIWELSDTEQRGGLVLTEFIIAMHLLTSMKTGALRSLPNVLPAALYEAATNRGASPSVPQSPTHTGITAIPRQLSGQAQVRASSPLGRPPITSQGTGSGVVPGPNDWAISPVDKSKFDQIYSTLDKSNKGYITGEEAVPFFSESRLPEDALAQIWDLADFNSSGQLTREGFAIAMYLIRQQRGGRAGPLPTSLPPHLTPPSIRAQSRPSAGSPFEPPPMTQPPPPQPKSALEDLFGLDSGTSTPAPPAPMQTTMSTGGSVTKDPFAGGSSVLSPSSPARASPTGSQFKPFVPSSSFGRGLSGPPPASQPSQSGNDDLLGGEDEASKNISGEATELANISSQITTLAKQTQDTQAKRTNTQTELNQTNSQKQNFEQRLAQLRTLYEKEAQDTHALEEQLRNARNDTKKLQSECLTLEGTYRDIQGQHQQVLASLQADQQENTSLRERIRAVNGEISQLKPQIEKLKSEARQQKGLVAINKKQLSTTEGEREKLKSEAEDLAKSNEEAARQASTGSPASQAASMQAASPALSTSSGNNPFFKRSASTDIMGVLASPLASPPARAYSNDKSFDDVFGPSFSTSATSSPAPAAATLAKPQHTGASTASAASFSTPPAGSPTMSRQATLNGDPPAPPENKQITSSFLPLPEHSDSLSSSRHVSPPTSRAEGSGSDAKNPFPGDEAMAAISSADIPGAFPSVVTPDVDSKDMDIGATPTGETESTPSTLSTAKASETDVTSSKSDPFGTDDQAKAKAEFENAFAAFTSAKSSSGPQAAPEANKGPSGFASEFPPISELNNDDESDSSSEGGFDDDFAPSSPEAKKRAGAAAESDATPPAVPAKDEPTPKSEQPSSPATITSTTAPTIAPQTTTVDDFFGTAATGIPPAAQPAPPSNPPTQNTFDDLEDDFEGLEDAKEGSADDDFANISRSGLDDYNPVFDSSPPASQTKSESTAFGNESSFDFVSHASANGAAPASAGTPAPAPTGGAQQQKAPAAETHDWDAIFSGLDSPTAAAATPAPPAAAQTSAAGEAGQLAVPDADSTGRPLGPGRLLTQEGRHDDPILKNLTSMGYSRANALNALEKYDYNLERAANYLASQS